MTSCFVYALVTFCVMLCAGLVESAKECYRCDSSATGTCSDDFLYKGQIATCVVNSAPIERYCAKVTTSENGKPVWIKRTCAIAKINGCQTVDNQRICTASCESDKCNRSLRPNFEFLVILGSYAMFWWLHRMATMF